MRPRSSPTVGSVRFLSAFALLATAGCDATTDVTGPDVAQLGTTAESVVTGYTLEDAEAARDELIQEIKDAINFTHGLEVSTGGSLPSLVWALTEANLAGAVNKTMSLNAEAHFDVTPTGMQNGVAVQLSSFSGEAWTKTEKVEDVEFTCWDEPGRESVIATSEHWLEAVFIPDVRGIIELIFDWVPIPVDFNPPISFDPESVHVTAQEACPPPEVWEEEIHDEEWGEGGGGGGLDEDEADDGPQGEVLCHYRIYYDIFTGDITDIERLYCFTSYD